MARIVITVTDQEADEIREWLKTHEKLTLRPIGGSRLWHVLGAEIEEKVREWPG